MNESESGHAWLSLGGTASLGWTERLRRFPWSLLLLLLLTIFFGFGVLYSAVGGENNLWLFWRQVIQSSIGIGIMLTVALLAGEKIFRRFSYMFYFGSLTLLAVTMIMGSVGMGARRWLEVGFFRLQTSELMKVALILALARYFHDHAKAGSLGWRDLGVPFLMILCPMAFIIKQPDLGTAVLLAGVGLSIVVVAGISWKVLFTLVIVLGASMPLAWNGLHTYQKQRIITLFSPERDPLGSGYHIIQSKIAVGSGGVTGKGFMAGSQSQLDFLPERHTDFIFSVLAEEWGFLGGVTLLVLYALLILRALLIAEMANDRFGLLTVVGATMLFSVQVVVNVGMVLGLLPVVGVPLPLISYGGSSMVTLMIAMGLLAHVSLYSRQHGRSV
ncbi:MAG: rod shape-determining protein RodA [Magnetococcales bacterium]|nr:rod shape-determining protein RodA [Magnetococcales bacterium]